jgi:acetyl-CoA carboxylase carboxyl transferase beta subunit
MFEALKNKLKSLRNRSDGTQPKIKCTACGREIDEVEMLENLMICPACGKYNRMDARTRIDMITDASSFRELYSDYKSKDFLEFPGYSEKLEKAIESTGEKDAVVCGFAEICRFPVAIFVMDSRFFMASMGSVVGEKITLLFEAAIERGLPVIGFTASGGARMQEGIISLMQMAKVSGAVKRHSDAGNLYIAVLTDPTTGGVTASFAMQGDILLAEPKALIGFAGRRVVEQATGIALPDNFQTAEFLLEHGFIDSIVKREEMRITLATLLKIHSKKRRGTA